MRELNHTRIIGVWDDHDYGIGNGNKDYDKKDGAREIFLDFIGEDRNSDRRTEKQTGLYQDYIIKHQLQNKQGNITQEVTIHVVLLDVRYDYDK